MSKTWILRDLESRSVSRWETDSGKGVRALAFMWPDKASDLCAAKAIRRVDLRWQCRSVLWFSVPRYELWTTERFFSIPLFSNL